MKTALRGRVVFGASAMLLGVIALIWWDSDTWQTLSWIWRLPLGRIAGGILMIVQIAGGVAALDTRTTRLSSTLLGIVYLLFSLTCLPDIAAEPAVYAHYGNFFEQFSALCGAIALYAATEANEARAIEFGRVARLGLGACAISFTLSQILYLSVTASLVPAWIPPNPIFWAILTTVAFALAAIAILINRQTRLAIRLMSLMLALFGVLVWIPRLIAHPETHLNWSEFGLTFLIAGAALTVAAVKSF